MLPIWRSTTLTGDILLTMFNMRIDFSILYLLSASIGTLLIQNETPRKSGVHTINLQPDISSVVYVR